MLLPIVLDVPFFAPAAKGITRSPVLDRTSIAGIPVDLAHPPGAGPWPAYLFVNGAHPLRRQEPVVDRLITGLARAGYLALAPDLPGLGSGEITVATVDAATAVAVASAKRSDVRGDRVALLGVSTGASLALLVAARDEVAERVSVVVAVTPFGDVEKILRLATTGAYVEDEAGAPTPPVSPLLRRVVARSLIASLEPGDERTVLLGLLPADEEEDIPPALWRHATSNPEARAILDCLENEDSAEFSALYSALPGRLQETLGALSPLRHAHRIRAPVELVIPPSDEYFPLEEAVELARTIPDSRMTMTATLDHTRPGIRSGRIADLTRFTRFAVRGLAAAL